MANDWADEASPRGMDHVRPATPELVFGEDVLVRGLHAVPSPYALITQPEPLEASHPEVRKKAGHVSLVSSLREADLEGLASGIPGVAAVVGVGGGTAMDAAKFVAWRHDLPLLLAPSAVSVDASVTNTIAVRVDGRVEYRGFIVAKRIFVDFGLIGQAPARMNRAGLGDLLSIHTALWDWGHGVVHGGAPVVPDVARRAGELLDLVTSLARDIRVGSPRGVEAVMRAYAEINDMANVLRHAQLEEGSEHYFVYCLESVTGRSFIHGEAVTLGVILMADLQGNDPEWARAIADEAGVTWRPADLGLTPGEVVATLGRLPGFVRAAGLPWSVIDQSPIDEATAARLAGVAR